VRGRAGARPLAMAAGYGNAEMLAALIDLGANPYVALGGGPSLLALAAAGAWDIDYQWTGCGPHTATVRALQSRAPGLKAHESVWDWFAATYVSWRGCPELTATMNAGLRR
jgi:hypothetical protein